MPPSPLHPALAGPTLGFAHRGFTRTGAVENTVGAFDAAHEVGLRHLETDVRVTRDGVCVAFHDETLTRIAGRPERLAELSWDQVRGIDLGAGEGVPRFDEVLRRFPDCAVSVDCKTPQAVASLAAAIRETGAAQRVIVSAFDGRRSRAVARLAPGVARSPGRGGVVAGVLAAGLWRLGAAGRGVARAVVALGWRGCHVLQVPERAGRLRVLSPALVAVAHDTGRRVHVWTVNDVDDMRRLRAMGVDGLISDRSDLLVEVLGRWPA